MRRSEFNYELLEEHIGKIPAEPRDSAKLLVARDGGDGGGADGGGAEKTFDHKLVRDVVELIEPGDVVVRNTTRVRKARLVGTRPTGGTTEILLLHPRTDEVWEALVKPSAKIPAGTIVTLPNGGAIDVRDDLGAGRRLVASATAEDLEDTARSCGAMPLPPYLGDVQLADNDRYQTVYSHVVGSVAAPTAGLHFTNTLFAEIEARGATVCDVELHVGIGTFRPITADSIDEHVMHEERYSIPEHTRSALEKATRIIAIGTTSVRTLETYGATGEARGVTSIFITPGFTFSLVDVMVTNFHLPESSLLVMVEAFFGPAWRNAYAIAKQNDYRFLSFGDAMWLEKDTNSATQRNGHNA